MKILEGHCVEMMRTMEAESVQCCVSSPPYYSLRDYGIPASAWEEITYTPMVGLAPVTIPAMECCLGLEADPAAFVGHLVAVYREVWRVLRADGTCWVNLGDSYSGGGNGGGGFRASSDGPKRGEAWDQKNSAATWKARNGRNAQGYKPKDLMMMPARCAMALQADGWTLRSEIIWSKPNPMPESVYDRPTKSHEQIYLLAKGPDYFYDADGIKEPQTGGAHARMARNQGADGTDEFDLGSLGESVGPAAGALPPGVTPKSVPAAGGGRIKANHSFHAHCSREVEIPGGRNRRTVWSVLARGTDEKHFATYPKDLVAPCILAGTSDRGACATCGAPWARQVEKARTFESGSGRSGNLPSGKNGAHWQGGGETKDIRRGPVVHTRTVGWAPTCRRGSEALRPCLVLDPFSGSGTTGVVAEELGRDYVGCEMNGDYVKISLGREARMTPGFALA